MQRALTHPSYTHLGAVLGEVKIAASNCGLRRPQVKEDWRAGLGGDVKALVHHVESQPERERLRHNEQLEFLGDAALEFLCRCMYSICSDGKLLVLFLVVFISITCFQVLSWDSWHPIAHSWSKTNTWLL